MKTKSPHPAVPEEVARGFPSRPGEEFRPELEKLKLAPQPADRPGLPGCRCAIRTSTATVTSNNTTYFDILPDGAARSGLFGRDRRTVEAQFLKRDSPEVEWVDVPHRNAGKKAVAFGSARRTPCRNRAQVGLTDRRSGDLAFALKECPQATSLQPGLAPCESGLPQWGRERRWEMFFLVFHDQQRSESMFRLQPGSADPCPPRCVHSASSPKKQRRASPDAWEAGWEACAALGAKTAGRRTAHRASTVSSQVNWPRIQCHHSSSLILDERAAISLRLWIAGGHSSWESGGLSHSVKRSIASTFSHRGWRYRHQTWHSPLGAVVQGLIRTAFRHRRRGPAACGWPRRADAARGNSGAIMRAFFQGVAEVLESCPQPTSEVLARLALHAIMSRPKGR